MHKGDHRANEGRGGEGRRKKERRRGRCGFACFLMWIDGLMAVA